MLTKWRSQQVYNMILKFRKWWTIYDGGLFILAFYIFKGETLHDTYIQNYKPYNYMLME
jgi:hypothetical protein